MPFPTWATSSSYHAVDLFILYDDVAFPKQGWVNRNFLGARCGPQRFTLAVQKPKLGQTIVDTRLYQRAAQKHRLLKTVETIYHRAPYYELVSAVLEEATDYADDALSDFLCHSIQVLNRYLGIATPLARSSEDFRHIGGSGAKRVIGICGAAGAKIYVNAEGGLQLYSESLFRQHGIELCFLVHEPRSYQQNCGGFIPRLSIIDVMMFNSRERMAELLNEYRLISAPKEATYD